MTTLPNVEPLVLEEIDLPLPCRWHEELPDRCRERATWIITWSCGCFELYCVPHADAARELTGVLCEEHPEYPEIHVVGWGPL